MFVTETVQGKHFFFFCSLHRHCEGHISLINYNIKFNRKSVMLINMYKNISYYYYYAHIYVIHILKIYSIK